MSAPVIWKDVERLDVDFGGTDLGSVELWRIDAEAKQLVSSETIATQEGYDVWFGICMYVGLREIAVGMWKMSLLEEINTPEGFNANAWEVTVEKAPVQ